MPKKIINKISENKFENDSLFKSPFLKTFYINKKLLPWSEADLLLYDQELATFNQSLLGLDLERGLIDHNELLISYAISKAENSVLTLTEARKLQKELIADAHYNFIKEKLKNKGKLTKKDYDELEFFNIIKVFRKYSQLKLTKKDFNLSLILDLHAELTAGLDLFAEYLPNFDRYNSGKWRKSDDIRVASFVPAPAEQIIAGVQELLKFISTNPGALNIAIFHVALYALHPFTNGNKRVCRILEYLLLKFSAYNTKSLYNTSFYYYQHQNRYYKKLLDSLFQHNFNHFVSFWSESLVYSVLGVVKTSEELKKKEFLKQFELDPKLKKVIRPLIKFSELQFTKLWALNKRRPAKQTFSNYLEQLSRKGVIERRASGRNVYYRLSGVWPEDEFLRSGVQRAASRIKYIPEEFRLV